MKTLFWWDPFLELLRQLTFEIVQQFTDIATRDLCQVAQVIENVEGKLKVCDEIYKISKIG